MGREPIVSVQVHNYEVGEEHIMEVEVDNEGVWWVEWDYGTVSGHLPILTGQFVDDVEEPNI